VASSDAAGRTPPPQQLREALWNGSPELTTLLAGSPDRETLVRAVEACAAAFAAGRLPEVMAIFRETAADRRWRPLFEALRALEAGSADYLRRVAPEVRTAAEPLRALLGRPGSPQ
jgi:hypothetical protein